ncbi:MAG: guanine deaminase [Pseudoruegeria sp.]
MTDIKLLLGQTLHFTDDPFQMDIASATCHHRYGAVCVQDGKILDVGAADILIARYPTANRTDYGDKLITAGFIDAHVHFPQTAIIASWGKRLIDWLNSYTFPEEMKFGDPEYAEVIAARYFDLMLSHGTTSCTSFATIHPESVEAFFRAAQSRNLRVVTGKCCMDRNAPARLCDTPQSAYDLSKTLADKWHGVDRLSYAITPRFSPTSTPEQLEALGGLWAEYPDLLMQTHLSEQTDEVAWVKSLYPTHRDYLDTYEAYGLLRPGAMFGHAIYLEDREKDRLRDVDAALIHCPTSNTFIGSGVFDMAGLKSAGHRIGLATDTGGGSSFSMLRTMAAAYELGQLNGTPLHAAQLYWLATKGSARSMRMDDKIGNLANGLEADLIVLDLASTPAIAQRAAMAEDFWELLFPTLMMGDDRAIKSVWINGNQVLS